MQIAQADTTPASGVPATVSADGLPTWQVNGVVWSQVVVGNTVYVTGSFATARPPGVAVGGAGEVAAANIFAFDITTGNRVATFSHQLNAQGLAIAASPDGTKVFVGGDFTTVDGAARSHIAAFSTATGALTSFSSPVGGQVRALAATNATVYVGGAYTAVGNSVRNRLSAHDSTTGVLRTTWAPSADNTVWAMTLSPDATRVIVGGSFTTLNGVSAYGMGSTDATSGATLAWAANKTIKNAGDFGSITTLRTDGNQIYGGAYSFGAGTNFEGTFAADPTTGALNWANDCHGDTYDVLPVGQVLYQVGHTHDCTWIGGFPDTKPRVRWQRATAFTTYPTGKNTGPDSYGWHYEGITDSSLLQWFPDLTAGTVSGQAQAAWSLAGNASYTVAGGEFPKVNGVAQQGLVRFAVKSIAPNKRGPSYTTVPATPVPAITADSLYAGTARVRFGTAWDRDNELLTYALIRDNKVVPGATKQLKSNFWQLPGAAFVDTGLVPGSSHNYQIRITDPFGNTQYSLISSPVTISSTAPSAYSLGVFQDGASSYWRLNEPSGTAVTDYAGFADATAGAGVTRGAAGAIAGDSDKATTFNGTSTGTAGTTAVVAAPASFTLEAWVKTTSTSGGQIVGFGSSSLGSSSSHDRQLYMDNTGKIWFAVNPGTVKAISSTGTYRDGTWHHVVASQDATNGITLYVDGAKVTSDATATSAMTYNGYWRTGGDNLTGLPNKPTSGFLAGTIDDVAVYPAALSSTKVQQHYVAAGGGPTNLSPTASFTSSAADLVASVDGSASSDADGTVASYSWDFGDGTAAVPGVSPSHTYAAANTYQVKLTVTDNQGATGTVTHAVTVAAAPVNQPPVAAFTSATTNLAASFDGSGSTDPDGTIASYSWDFGDSSNGTGASPTHTYATAGDYTVKLTVTDDQNATDTATHVVTVAAGPPVNQKPVAAFTSATTNLSASFDGSGSADPDGTVDTYSWDFADGTAAGSGPSPTHLYAAAGTYLVKLTVTDNQGATDTVTHSVTVTAAAAQPVVADTFGRTVATGWGSAETGGLWTVNASGQTVSGGVGSMTVAAGGTGTSYLNATTTNDADLTVKVSSDKVGLGNGVYLNVFGRRVSGAGDYRLQTRLRSDGLVGVSILRGTVVVTAETIVPGGYHFVAGDNLNVRFQVTGTSPTTMRAKVWPAATTEPTTWLVSGSDSTAGLQVSGTVGLGSFLSGSATNGPVTISFDDLFVRPTAP